MSAGNKCDRHITIWLPGDNCKRDCSLARREITSKPSFRRTRAEINYIYCLAVTREKALTFGSFKVVTTKYSNNRRISTVSDWTILPKFFLEKIPQGMQTTQQRMNFSMSTISCEKYSILVYTTQVNSAFHAR